MPRYSATVMDHFQSPRNWGKLEGADLIGVAGNPGHGGYLIIYLVVKGDRIIDIRYNSHGCGATIAAGSMLTELVLGKPVDECLEITSDDLTANLDGLPPDKRHCSFMAIAALRNALDGSRPHQAN